MLFLGYYVILLLLCTEGGEGKGRWGRGDRALVVLMGGIWAESLNSESRNFCLLHGMPAGQAVSRFQSGIFLRGMPRGGIPCFLFFFFFFFFFSSS